MGTIMNLAIRFLINSGKLVGGILLTIFVGLYLTILAAKLSKPSDLPEVDIPQSLTIINAKIIDVLNGTVSPISNIDVTNGKITRIYQGEPDGAQNLYDAEGNYLVPGLTDMHVHLHDRKELSTNLAYGVTSVRNMRGAPMHLRWKEELNSKEWLGSNLYVSSPIINGEQYSHLLQDVITTPEQARQRVRRYKEAGYDLIKAYGYLEADEFEALMDEALKLGIPVAKHGPSSPTADRMKYLDTMQSVEHVEDIFQGPLNFEYDETILHQFLLEFKQTDTYITPTLATFQHLTQLSVEKEDFVSQIPTQQINPFYKWLYTLFAVERWLNASDKMAEWNQSEANILKIITNKLYDLDIPLLVGSDAGTMYMTAGTSTHWEMELMQDAGVPAKTILKAATWNAAASMELQAEYGSISTGKWADMILVHQNPLQDITILQQPIAVFKAGQILNRQAIESILKIADTPQGWLIGLGSFLEDLLAKA